MQLHKQFVAVLPSIAGAFTATVTAFLLNAGFREPDPPVSASPVLQAATLGRGDANRTDARLPVGQGNDRRVGPRSGGREGATRPGPAGERTTMYSGTFELGPQGVEAVVLFARTEADGARQVNRARVALDLGDPRLVVQKDGFRTEPAGTSKPSRSRTAATTAAGRTLSDAVARVFVGALEDAGDGLAREGTATASDGLRRRTGSAKHASSGPALVPDAAHGEAVGTGVVVVPAPDARSMWAAGSSDTRLPGGRMLVRRSRCRPASG